MPGSSDRHCALRQCRTSELGREDQWEGIDAREPRDDGMPAEGPTRGGRAMAHLLHAGEFATDGERRAAEVLRTLPRDWIVIANKILPASQGRSFEIDFIVIGDRVVYVIDEKSW